MSRLSDTGTTSMRCERPCVERIPKTPWLSAGQTMLPNMSVPMLLSSGLQVPQRCRYCYRQAPNSRLPGIEGAWIGDPISSVLTRRKLCCFGLAYEYTSSIGIPWTMGVVTAQGPEKQRKSRLEALVLVPRIWWISFTATRTPLRGF